MTEGALGREDDTETEVAKVTMVMVMDGDNGDGDDIDARTHARTHRHAHTLFSPPNEHDMVPLSIEREEPGMHPNRSGDLEVQGGADNSASQLAA